MAIANVKLRLRGSERTWANFISHPSGARIFHNAEARGIISHCEATNGIKAQHITCMPYEDPFEDCHVVVDCVLPSGERIMLDPTSRLYYKDEDGKYVSLPHLRELLIADKPIFANPDAGHNGGSFDAEYNRNYMIKNTFRFARCTLNKDGVDGHTDDSRYIELIPCNYPTENHSERYKADPVYNDTDFRKI